jgi:hypothetical protein
MKMGCCLWCNPATVVHHTGVYPCTCDEACHYDWCNRTVHPAMTGWRAAYGMPTFEE